MEVVRGDGTSGCGMRQWLRSPASWRAAAGRHEARERGFLFSALWILSKRAALESYIWASCTQFSSSGTRCLPFWCRIKMWWKAPAACRGDHLPFPRWNPHFHNYTPWHVLFLLLRMPFPILCHLANSTCPSTSSSSAGSYWKEAWQNQLCIVLASLIPSS